MSNKLLCFIGLLVGVSLAEAASPQIISAKADSAGAVLINWQSESNVVYRIDFATNLVDGGTQWRTIYEDYPSHGTNTIWKDAGNETGFIRVPHPNDTDKRFYRLVVTGTNASSKPQLGIVSPAAGSTLSDYVTVSVAVTSSLSVASIRLYVDGQEAGNQLYPETNFVINTAQFGNGPHKLFAVAENLDGAETTLEPANLVNNFVASPYHNVTFDNFISDFRGSALFVEPNDGESLTFKANFAAYSDWTLVISNSSAVTVRSASGTNYNMTFIWDGKDGSGNDLPADFYSATLSATTSTNTPPAPAPSPSTNPPPPSATGAQSASASGESDSSAWYPTDWAGALLGGWDHYFTPPPPLPPPLAEELGPQPWVAVPVPGQKASFSNADDESYGLAAAGGGGTTTLIPPRVIHNLGTMALAYQGHHPSVGFGTANRPSNGAGGRVVLNGGTGITGAFGPLKSCQRIMMGFQGVMQTRGFKLEWGRADDNVTAANLVGSQYGGSNQFNRANIGLLVGHGVFGTTPDFTTSGSGPLETYFPVYKTGVNSYDWVRFTQFQFGGSGSNLRWMGILSCNNMFPDNYDDMWNKELLPIGDNLHLLLGASSTVYLVSNFGREYASALTGANGVQRQSIQEAWFYAGTKSQGFQTSNPKRTVTFRVAGWPNCFSDDLLSYQSPDSGNPGDIESVQEQVFVP